MSNQHTFQRVSAEAGPVLGGLLLGIGAGIGLERLAMGIGTRLRDPEAREPFGELHGRPATLTSFDGTRLHLEEFGPARGSAPCLVFAHGFSLCADAWHYQRRDLPAGYRCVFVDQRGHGSSGRPDNGDYSLEAIARDLRALLAWTGERPVLVAHSMSGMASLKLAELHGGLADLVSGLVLVDTSYADALRGLAAAAMSEAARRIQTAVLGAGYRITGHDPDLAQTLRRRGSDFGYLATRLFGFGSRPSPAQVAFTDRMLAATDGEVWSAVWPGLLDFDFGHVLQHVDVPTLVVVGDKDRLTPIDAARHMAASIPGGRLVVLPDSGHMAFLEEHERLNAHLRVFTDEVTGTGGGRLPGRVPFVQPHGRPAEPAAGATAAGAAEDR